MGQKQELVVLLGAGASAHTGIPMTNALTEELSNYQLKGSLTNQTLWIQDPKFDSPLKFTPTVYPCSNQEIHVPPIFKNEECFFQTVLTILKREFAAPNFEHILAALEELEAISRSQQFSMLDDFRAVIAPFVKITNENKMLSHPTFLHYAQETLIQVISQTFQNKLNESTEPEKETKTFFEQVRKTYNVSIFNLNYDDLLERSGFCLRDGFTETHEDFLAYSTQSFENSVAIGEEIHCHLHGSILFGYPTGTSQLLGQLVKYPTAAPALKSLLGTSVGGLNIKGTNVTGRPLISGFNKLSKLHFSPVPYRGYFRAFAQKLNGCARLLIIGYGGYDDHVNLLLREFMTHHGQRKRVVYVLPREGKDLGKIPGNSDRLMLEFAAPTDFLRSQSAYFDDSHPQEFSVHGSLALCAAGFPFRNPDTFKKMIEFLD